MAFVSKKATTKLNQLNANQTVNIWGVGAGIFLWESLGDLKIDNCVFTQNTPYQRHGNGDGSCIYLNAESLSNFDIKISNTKFIENYSDGSLFQLNSIKWKLGIMMLGQLSFANVDFQGNNGNSLNIYSVVIEELSFANVDFLNNYGQDIGVTARTRKVSNADFPTVHSSKIGND